MKCCGMKNYTDWLEEHMEIPSSCYDQVIYKHHSVGQNHFIFQIGDDDTMFDIGCYDQVLARIGTNITILTGNCIATGVDGSLSIFSHLCSFCNSGVVSSGHNWE